MGRKCPAISNRDFIAMQFRCDCDFLICQGTPNGGGCQTGGFSDLARPAPLFSFLGLSRFFWDFPDLLGDGLGIFPIRPFSLSRPIKSPYEEQSQKGQRHNLDLSRKNRHRVNGIGRRGGRTVFNQIPWNPVKIWGKSG